LMRRTAPTDFDSVSRESAPEGGSGVWRAPPRLAGNAWRGLAGVVALAEPPDIRHRGICAMRTLVRHDNLPLVALGSNAGTWGKRQIAPLLIPVLPAKESRPGNVGGGCRGATNTVLGDR